MKKTIVVSAVNLFSGGTLQILNDCLASLSNSFADKYRIIAIVHKKNLLPKYDNIELIEYPKSRKHYLYRCYYEYFAFKNLSKNLKPYLWLSLHDMSPRVVANRQAVYMHNSSPFYKFSFKDLLYAPTYALFSLFYKYVYKVNIHSNKFLVVQQQWLRDSFSKMFDFNKENIIVAPPQKSNMQEFDISKEKRAEYVFFYPSFPRVFKNFEIVCHAVELLEQRNVKNYNVVLTIDGSENKYTKKIVKKYNHLKNVSFVGLLKPEEVKRQYENTDCLLFPSNLETCGLPIMEFMVAERPMIVADLPYAHETSAGGDKVAFFNPKSAEDLANKMERAINEDYSIFNPVAKIDYNSPVVYSWKDLFDTLLK